MSGIICVVYLSTLPVRQSLWKKLEGCNAARTADSSVPCTTFFSSLSAQIRQGGSGFVRGLWESIMASI
jgi:hypothetical protein